MDIKSISDPYIVLSMSFKNLHLAFSGICIIGVALVYGASPEHIIPYVFDLEVDKIELKNILRAIMGLYLAFAVYWLIGAQKEEHWKAATLSNIIFMGGLAFGRILSTVFDGFSPQFTVGLGLEVLIMSWGIWSLRRYGNTT
ncbi:MAG: DUF4345 domain-containing protein [Bacteroidota bacterium]